MIAQETIAKLDWASLGAQLDQEGYAILPGFLSEEQARQLADEGCATEYGPQQSSSPMAAEMRAGFYKHLVPVANRWNEVLDETLCYPATLAGSLGGAHPCNKARVYSIISRLREGEYQALHQWNSGDLVFPLQLAALLSEPGEDFTGGEFVMTEQRPRMQSRPIVVPLRKGDVAIITTAKRPHKGTQGYYRVSLKHAVSRVCSGERVGWELLLHDAVQG